jgi:hypothetical protein
MSLSLVVALATTAHLSAQNELPLDVGITGSTPTDPRRNPTEILGSPEVQRLVLAIAERPHTRAEVGAAVAGRFFGVDDMVATGLLREEGERLRLDFNLLRVDDQQRILEATESIGRDLAGDFLEHRGRLTALAARHDQPRDVGAELLFVVVGCFSLDWDGLALAEERGWRDGAQRTIDGHAFTPWAKEKGAAISLERLFWGSHNASSGDLWATTFGDHHSLPRFGLPDLLWRSNQAFTEFEDVDARRAAARLVSSYAMDSLGDALEIMRLLRHENLGREALATATGVPAERLERLLALLEAAEYVELRDSLYEARVVVLLEEDASTVDAIVAAGRGIMTRWHEENYPAIRDQLSSLTPGRNGVPFERVYTEIWHFVFGIANRVLVDEGLFANPYATTRRHKGFIPAVWAGELVD